MYAEHVPTIAHAMREDLDTFKRGVLFAILSIRQPIRNVPAMLDDVERESASSVYLFGHKRKAYAWLQVNAERLWLHLKCDAGAPEPEASRAALHRLIEVPGLGVVKAGFVAQLMGFDIACLDSRNVTRQGREPRAYRLDPRDMQGGRRKRIVDAYVADVGGQAAEYWDAWCEYVAPFHGLEAFEVSALHLAILSDDYIPF